VEVGQETELDIDQASGGVGLNEKVVVAAPHPIVDARAEQPQPGRCAKAAAECGAQDGLLLGGQSHGAEICQRA